MEELAARGPGFAVGLDEDAAVVPEELAHGDHARPRRVLVAALLKQLSRYLRVGDDDGGPASDPEGEDWSVSLGPIGELVPWLRLGELVFVSDERKRWGAGRHAAP